MCTDRKYNSTGTVSLCRTVVLDNCTQTTGYFIVKIATVQSRGPVVKLFVLMRPND